MHNYFMEVAWEMYKNIMFDLDGTVTDSGRAIMTSVEYALSHFGKEKLKYG